MGLELKSNSRQMPKTKDYLANANFCDFLYGYLQTISVYRGAGQSRVIPKALMNWSQIAKEIDISRQTVKTKIDKLIKIGLLKKLDNGDYELVSMPLDVAELIPFETLRVLSIGTNKNVIKTFVYLSTRYRANEYKPFRFTYNQIKIAIGLGNSSSSNNDVIKILLSTLMHFGLINYSVSVLPTSSGSFETCNIILDMNNEIAAA